MKLTDFYQKNEEQLKSQVESAKTTEEVVQIFQGEIKRLADTDGEFLKELTPPVARTAQKLLLETLNSFLGVLKTVRLSSSSFDKKAEIIGSSESKNSFLKNAVKAAPIAGALAGMAFGPLPTITGSLIGTAVRELCLIDKETGSQQAVLIDNGSLLSLFKKSLERIEQIINEFSIERNKPSQKAGIEEHKDILEFLQNLMADASHEQNELPAFTRDRIGGIRMLLKKYGIEAMTYQPDNEHSGSMFSFEKSAEPEVKEYVTQKQAFIKDGRILLHGLVSKPILEEE